MGSEGVVGQGPMSDYWEPLSAEKAAELGYGPGMKMLRLKLSRKGGTDMKAGMGKKAPLAHVPQALMYYSSRAHQFGADKYRLGNYLQLPPSGVTDVDRLLEYISAAQRHLSKWADSIVRFQGDGVGKAKNILEACFAPDDESALPHAAHVAATLGMAIQQAVDAGLMPIDPGVTWDREKVKLAAK